MQYDMHYYGTYALACGAGIQPEDAQIIAYSAQNVDDQNSTLVKRYGEKHLLKVATAHHPLEAGIRARLKPEYPENDARTVWVPFHFFPGGEGPSFEERMTCSKNGKIVQALLEHYLELPFARNGIGLQLVGIAAHVYADTFSHYDFIGIASSRNKIRQATFEYGDEHSQDILDYIEGKARRFFDQLKGNSAEISPLGHGPANTMPDRPFLRFRFTFEDSRDSGWRDNPATFLEACEALHDFFSRFARQRYAVGAIKPTAWGKLEGVIKEILATEADAAGRVKAWVDAMRQGRLGGYGLPKDYSEGMFEDDYEANRRFHAAADYHRTYVLRLLLPKHELKIV